MATKHITDKQVLEAYVQYSKDNSKWPYEILMERTGEPEKVCFNAMLRAVKRGYIDYGVSVRSGWLTPKGIEYLKESK